MGWRRGGGGGAEEGVKVSAQRAAVISCGHLLSREQRQTQSQAAGSVMPGEPLIETLSLLKLLGNCQGTLIHFGRFITFFLPIGGRFYSCREKK